MEVQIVDPVETPGKASNGLDGSRSHHYHSAASTPVRHGTLSTAVSGASTPVSTTSSAKRLYRTAGEKWVTRDIAALDFMLGIPMQAEQDLVQQGWRLQQRHESEDSQHDREDYKQEGDVLGPPSMPKGRWWEKFVHLGEATTPLQGNNKTIAAATDDAKLERPSESEALTLTPTKAKTAGLLVPTYAPGRRLEGDEAVRIQIPLTTDTVTKQKSIARQAALREWELETAHGLQSDQPPMLGGRLFFSAAGSYPMSVFSVIRYEPKKEEAALRRQKLEARGGGGTQFIVPPRDWRGISYRALLPRQMHNDRNFNRFFSKDHLSDENHTDDEDASSTTSVSSEDSDLYVPGLLDDPEMVLGRHRNVMIGDRVTGPIVSSTIQFVKPALLKAELNKQFRERFDGWEPPRLARKFIGARVIDGVYTLMDPAEEYQDRELRGRSRQGSTASSTTGEGAKEKTIRIPPSLTLSKIRSLKHQALRAAVKAKLGIGTVALACVYFERLCLDCRVDKSNRRLSFAACLLLATKLNEPNVGLVMKRHEEETSEDENIATRLQSLIRPNKQSDTVFASLLEFFTQDWNLSLKHLFDAEWGVFAALGFSLHATPSQVAFHFKRLMKTLEWNPLTYLGSEMYAQWQEALASEEERRTQRERRREKQRRRKEERLLDLHIELQNKSSRRNEDGGDEGPSKEEQVSPIPGPARLRDKKAAKKGGIGFLNSWHRIGRPMMRRTASQEKIHDPTVSVGSEHPSQQRRAGLGLPTSPSMPILPTLSDMGIVAIDIPSPKPGDDASVASSIHSNTKSDEGIIV